MHIVINLRQREIQGKRRKFLYTSQIATSIAQSVDLVFPVGQIVTDSIPVLAYAVHAHCRRLRLDPEKMLRYTYLLTLHNTFTLHYKTYVVAYSAPLTNRQILLNLPYKIKLIQDLLLQVGTTLP